MSNAIKKERPQFRNIHITQIPSYRLPLAGVVSILHRISGLLMFVLLPVVLFLFQKSILSEISYEHFRGIASHPVSKLVILALSWAYFHHFCAGVRHLVMDTHIGLEKHSARKSAASVLVVSLVLTALVALKLFGAF